VQAGKSDAARQRPDAPIWSQAAERFPPADRVLSTILTRQATRYRDRTLFVFGFRHDLVEPQRNVKFVYESC